MTSMNFSSTDYGYMARAIELAWRGRYTTHPNPRVGCVLVREGQVVGEGWHVRAGEGHAEVNALRQAGEQARGATAYVTLEPCSHFGRTPPCADTLVQAGISRMVCAMVDPNPQVAGRGLDKLRQAGVEVASGLLEAQARALNPGFIRRMESGRPFVRLKLAMSADGRTAMASGESQWITGAAARADVQRLRAQSAAILTGIDSLLLDDSSLTVRSAELGVDEPWLDLDQLAQRQPLRVVLDSRLRLPATARILHQPGRTRVLTGVALSDNAAADLLIAAGAELTEVALNAEGRIDLAAVLQRLAGEEQCNELLVECGATLAGAFIAAGLVDELVVYLAPKLLGNLARPLLALPLERMAEQVALELVDLRQIGNDLRLTWRPARSEEN